MSEEPDTDLQLHQITVTEECCPRCTCGFSPSSPTQNMEGLWRSAIAHVDSDGLWELLERWYQIAANEAVDTGTRHGYRECANQLDDLLGAPVTAPLPDRLRQAAETVVELLSMQGYTSDAAERAGVSAMFLRHEAEILEEK